MKHIVFVLLLFLGALINLYGQNKFELAEQEILLISDSLSQTKVDNDVQKQALANKIKQQFATILADSSSFMYKFDKLKHVGVVCSPDLSFRFIQWNYITKSGEGRYFGFIQLNPSTKTGYKCVSLDETFEKIINYDLLIKQMPTSAWYGTLYYSIIPVKTDKGTIYTLLGIRFNDIFTTKKIIETLQIKDNGKIVFGVPIIIVATKKQNRMVFEYSNKTSMGLKYYDNIKTIVFDHLAPDIPLHTGNFKYYGADFTFDALRLEQNNWVFLSNYDYKQPKEEIRKGPKPKIIRGR